MKSYGIAMGGKIYSLRVAKRMTQEQLAQELCISPAAMSKWERNQTIPSIEMLWALADFFDCTIDELVGRKGVLLERVGVYDKEKLKLVTIAEELLRCSEISRQEGLFAMEEAMSTHYQGNSRFLPFAVRFMCRAHYKEMDKEIGPQLFGQLVENYAAALPEAEQAEGRMIAAVLPRIFMGEHPKILWELLTSYIGMEYRELLKPLDGERREWEKTREEILEKLKSKELYSAATDLLEPLAEMDDFTIQVILRNIDNLTLAAAMYGASGRVVKRFFESVSDTVLYYVNEDLEKWQGTEEDILSAQRRVLELGAWTGKEDIRE